MKDVYDDNAAARIGFAVWVGILAAVLFQILNPLPSPSLWQWLSGSAKEASQLHAGGTLLVGLIGFSLACTIPLILTTSAVTGALVAGYFFGLSSTTIWIGGVAGFLLTVALIEFGAQIWGGTSYIGRKLKEAVFRKKPQVVAPAPPTASSFRSDESLV